MAGIDTKQFRVLIINTLTRFVMSVGDHDDGLKNELSGVWDGNAAVMLLIITAYHESKLSYLKQVGGGPALGVFQIEPVTMSDVIDRLFHPEKRAISNYALEKVTGVCYGHPSFAHPGPDAGYCNPLLFNLAFQILIARGKYWLSPGALPAADDAEGQWRYYKKYYNSVLGAAKREDFLLNREIILAKLQ